MERTIIATSHDYVAASDCALYLRDQFHHLQHATFAVEADTVGGSMWKLIYIGDLDRVKNVIDLDYTSNVVGVARAFITGRGGLPLPAGGVVF